MIKGTLYLRVRKREGCFFEMMIMDECLDLYISLKINEFCGSWSVRRSFFL